MLGWNRKITFMGTGLLGAMLVASVAISAQPRGRHGEHENREFRGRDRGPGLGMLRELDLAEDQRQQIRTLFEELQATGAHERLMEARRALNDAVESGSSDVNAIQQLGYAIGQAEADAAVERVRMHGRIQEILTDEQRQELDRLKQEARQKMEERRKRFEERRARRGQRPEAL